MSGHAVGWPIARGGSRAIADALASYLVSLGGTVKVGAPVSSMSDLPRARAVLFDVTPRQLARIAGSTFPSDYLERLQRHRYGSGVFKVDWALNGPIPWIDPRCSQAGTLHLGGTLEEVAAAELDVWRGVLPENRSCSCSRTQPLRFEPCPRWYAHGLGILSCSQSVYGDMTQRIEAQVERFAPGFRSRVLARHTMSPTEMEDTTLTTSAATSPVECRVSGSYSSGLWDGGAHIPPGKRLVQFALPQCLPVLEYMECADILQQRWLSRKSFDGRISKDHQMITIAVNLSVVAVLP